jgi:hypothetical protein
MTRKWRAQWHFDVEKGAPGMKNIWIVDDDQEMAGAVAC